MTRGELDEWRFFIDTPALQAETDSPKEITIDNEWKEKYGGYLDCSTVNPLADTLISYATLWYEEASRTKEG